MTQNNENLVLALAQFSPVVGDVEKNANRIREIRAEAMESSDATPDIIVFSELCICGYPPEDLIFRKSFLSLIEKEVKKLAEKTADGGPALLIGAPVLDDGNCYNSALLLDNGKVANVIYKHHLPNYGPFNEARLFKQGALQEPVDFRGFKLGIMICRDIWEKDVPAHLKKLGAELFIVLNASPYEQEKIVTRIQTVCDNIRETAIPLVYVNTIGGQDELVFDGASFVLDHNASLKVHLPQWKEVVQNTVWKRNEYGILGCRDIQISKMQNVNESVYHAMMFGLRDYVNKNGFPGVIIGLSGGIDSALTAAVAVDALGADRVRCVMMPSPYTSKESLEDAEAGARMLGVQLDNISIVPAMSAFDGMLEDVFAGKEKDVTEENIQARARGVILMAMSNKLGYMVLSTGNKSEMSVGYATLYGDMCGGFSVLKDVYKTMVFDICRWRNENKPEEALGSEGLVMPDNVITKPPSAELRPNQKDEDSLPSYDVLDDILKCFIEEELGIQDTIAKGHDEKVAKKIWKLLHQAEYKRRQAPLGVKITKLSLGRDRRYPITNAYEGMS